MVLYGGRELYDHLVEDFKALLISILDNFDDLVIASDLEELLFVPGVILEEGGDGLQDV